MNISLRGHLSDCKNLQQFKEFIKCEFKGELEVFSCEELAVDTCFGLWPCMLFCSSFQSQGSDPSDPAEAGFWSIVRFYSSDILLSSQAARNRSLWNWQASRPFKDHSLHYQVAKQTIKKHYSFSCEHPWWRRMLFECNLPKGYRKIFIPWVKNINVIDFNTVALKGVVKHTIY